MTEEQIRWDMKACENQISNSYNELRFLIESTAKKVTSQAELLRSMCLFISGGISFLGFIIAIAFVTLKAMFFIGFGLVIAFVAGAVTYFLYNRFEEIMQEIYRRGDVIKAALFGQWQERGTGGIYGNDTEGNGFTSL